MSSLLERAKALRELCFSDINSFGRVTRELARRLASNQNLKGVTVDEELTIANQRLILEAIRGNGNIKRLSFHHVNPALASLCMNQMKSLEHAFFHRAFVVDDDGETLTLQLHRNLRKLQVHWGNMGDTAAEAAARVVRFRSCLTVIEFHECGLSNNGIISIGQSLQGHSMLSRVEVNGSLLVVEDEPAAKFAQGIETNTSVEKLIFRVDRVSLDGWVRIIRALSMNDTLKVVRLSLGALDREGWFLVARMLESTGTTTRETFLLSVEGDLHLNVFVSRPDAWDPNQPFRMFGLTRMGTENIRNACDALTSYDVADELVLAGDQVTMDGIRSIHGMLRNSSTLKMLRMSGCNIDEEMSGVLFEALKQNHSVESLDLSDNRIKAAAAADFIASSQKVKSLNLDGILVMKALRLWEGRWNPTCRLKLFMWPITEMLQRAESVHF